MKLTFFETSFLLGVDNPKEKYEELNTKFNKYIVRLFHTLLQKVEMDHHRQWTHDLLRNYVNASYIFCSNLNKRLPDSGQQKSINNYEDDYKKVYFTGLYTPETYQGLKNGLYFVATRQSSNDEWNISVMTKKDVFEEKFDGEGVLEKIDHKDSFENELVSHKTLCIKQIILPEPMCANCAKEIIDKHNEKIENVKSILQAIRDGKNLKQLFQDKVDFLKSLLNGRKLNIAPNNAERIAKQLEKIQDKITGNSWLHILRDGIDNLPKSFVKSFFVYECKKLSSKDRNNWKKVIEECIKISCNDDGCNGFLYFQEVMIDTMRSIKGKSSIQKLPAFCFIKGSSQNELQEDLTFNYLLPMYFMNSGKPDFCIVLKQTDKDEGIWEPVTSLNMDEVYCDIRVFGKDAIERVRDWW